MYRLRRLVKEIQQTYGLKPFFASSLTSSTDKIATVLRSLFQALRSFLLPLIMDSLGLYTLYLLQSLYKPSGKPCAGFLVSNILWERPNRDFTIVFTSLEGNTGFLTFNDSLTFNGVYVFIFRSLASLVFLLTVLCIDLVTSFSLALGLCLEYLLLTTDNIIRNIS